MTLRLLPEQYISLCHDVLERDEWKCRACRLRQNLHVHHIIFRSHQGPDATFNLITVCNECHEAIHRQDLILKHDGPVDANAPVCFIRLNNWKPK
jgi:hypothetical protein